MEINYTLDPDISDQDARDTELFFAMMNKHLQDENMRVEFDEDGTPRLYSTTRAR